MPHIAKNLSSFSKNEVKQLFKRARCALRHPGLTILYAPTSHDFGRILVVTARKVGSAPQRNLIRRRLKSIFYESAYYKLNYDIAILIRKEGTSLSFDELKKLVESAISQLPAHQS